MLSDKLQLVSVFSKLATLCREKSTALIERGGAFILKLWRL